MVKWKGAGRGWYVKGGRARCYLACSPDEISASSFRPSSPLLPRSFPPSLPSSYAFFLFCFCLPYTLSPAGSSVMPLRGEKFFRARHCQTFDCVGISLFLSCFSFSSYLNLFFFLHSFSSSISFRFSYSSKFGLSLSHILSSSFLSFFASRFLSPR